MGELPAEEIVAVDESSSHLSMSPAYGRGPKGERVPDTKPKSRGENVTMIGAIGMTGVVALNPLIGSNNGEMFLLWITECLVPFLKPGRIVLMDNSSIHKVAGVREAIEAAGASVLFIPPYSPEFNPIEECWSKVKTFLRRCKARVLGDLLDAIDSAVDEVTAMDCRGWFSHAGYAPST
jgi:transposase